MRKAQHKREPLERTERGPLLETYLLHELRAHIVADVEETFPLENFAVRSQDSDKKFGYDVSASSKEET